MNVGLVLSGGGARGAAHIGVLKALEEQNVEITHIAGTSSGAVVGAFYAAGYTWSETLQFFKSLPIFHYRRYAHKKPGFIDSIKFEKDLKKFFPKDSFEDLERELFITATNLNDGTSKIFNSGEMIKPLLASASLPGIFTPVHINKELYVDGGILNNFPVEPLIGLCDLIIGVYVNPLDNMGRKFRYSYQVMTRAYQIAIGHQSKLKFKHCDLLVLPDGLIKYGVFSLNNLDEIFETGYMTAKTLLSEKADILKQYHESNVSSP